MLTQYNYCKSCFISPIKSKRMCEVCLADYRYASYRKYAEKRQQQLGNGGVMKIGPRWNKDEMKILKQKIKEALITGSHTKIRAVRVAALFDINRTLANRILQELQRDGLIVRHGLGCNTFYQVVK